MTRAELVYGWVLDGPGPARYGWASVHPTKERWEGRTLAEISRRLTKPKEPRPGRTARTLLKRIA